MDKDFESLHITAAFVISKKTTTKKDFHLHPSIGMSYNYSEISCSLHVKHPSCAILYQRLKPTVSYMTKKSKTYTSNHCGIMPRLNSRVAQDCFLFLRTIGTIKSKKMNE